jgi:protoporphyrinogen oxidase
MKKTIVVLGSGLAGISVAYHLNPDEYESIVFEKNHFVGGTAGSLHLNGFTFDFAIHLLHLHNEYTKKLIKDLLKDNIHHGVRNAAIHIYEKLLPYPFQVNTFGLSKNVISECVDGFKIAIKKYAENHLRKTTLSFDKWSKRTFGTGITKHFMKPYNEKLWQVRNNEMTAEWCGMFVPQPNLEEIINGSIGNINQKFGYNQTFLYPKEGGIQVLPKALSQGLNIKLHTEFTELDLKKRRVRFVNGETYDYDMLVSSIPLPELLLRIKNLPTPIADLIKTLRWTSVLCLNLGIDRPNISDKSWIYFPEKKFCFYRVGFPMNFTPSAVPKNCSSMYVEISYRPHQPIDWKNPGLLTKVRHDLQNANILNKSDNILVSRATPIPYAYVIYTKERSKSLEKIFSFLETHQIFCVGRYGAWKYSYMEEAILDGKKLAEKIMML